MKNIYSDKPIATPVDRCNHCNAEFDLNNFGNFNLCNPCLARYRGSLLNGLPLVPTILKRVRKYLRLTQAELAARLKVSRAAYQSWELGKASVPGWIRPILEDMTQKSATVLWTSARLKEARLSLGLSRAEIARRIGVSAMTWGLWEQGKTQPRNKSEALRRLEQLLKEEPA
jgi:transcriptional regulator with XRE-family HTH domain